MKELRDRLREEFQDKDYADTYIDEFLNASIATQIKVLREQRGLTQGQLAQLAEMKQERICVLENVNYDSWSLKTLKRLASAFDVTLKVSFETFGTRIDDIRRFSRGSLQRESRTSDLAKLATPQEEGILGFAMKANKTVNQPRKAQSALENQFGDEMPLAHFYQQQKISASSASEAALRVST